MKRLIADVYIIIYRLTRGKMFSLIFSIAYVSALNLMALYGLGLLLKGWMPTGFIHKLFVTPYVLFTIVAMFLFNMWMMRPLKNLSKERNKLPYYPLIIAYTGVIIVLCV